MKSSFLLRRWRWEEGSREVVAVEGGRDEKAACGEGVVRYERWACRVIIASRLPAYLERALVGLYAMHRYPQTTLQECHVHLHLHAYVIRESFRFRTFPRPPVIFCSRVLLRGFASSFYFIPSPRQRQHGKLNSLLFKCCVKFARCAPLNPHSNPHLKVQMHATAPTLPSKS